MILTLLGCRLDNAGEYARQCRHVPVPFRSQVTAELPRSSDDARGATTLATFSVRSVEPASTIPEHESAR